MVLARFPALTLNYLAQGSLVLRSPKGIANPFFLLLPAWAQIPMVFLATVATVIASQSVISGAFSVTRQAVQLGFLPWLTIRHTSEREMGQIYVPAINLSLFVAVVAIVIVVAEAEIWLPPGGCIGGPFPFGLCNFGQSLGPHAVAVVSTTVAATALLGRRRWPLRVLLTIVGLSVVVEMIWVASPGLML